MPLTIFLLRACLRVYKNFIVYLVHHHCMSIYSHAVRVYAHLCMLVCATCKHIPREGHVMFLPQRHVRDCVEEESEVILVFAHLLLLKHLKLSFGRNCSTFGWMDKTKGIRMMYACTNVKMVYVRTDVCIMHACMYV